MRTILYTVCDSITRQELFLTWSFDMMMEYRDMVYLKKGWITFMRYSSFSQNNLEIISNSQLNSGAYYDPRR